MINPLLNMQTGTSSIHLTKRNLVVLIMSVPSLVYFVIFLLRHSKPKNLEQSKTCNTVGHNQVIFLVDIYYYLECFTLS